MKTSKQLLTVHQLAVHLGLPAAQVETYTLKGSIPYVVRQGEYYYNLSAVLDALAGELGENHVPKKVTYEDYRKFPAEQGFRVEVVDGQIIKDPLPVPGHEIVSLSLQRILTDYFLANDPEGFVYAAPLDLTLSNTDILQPALLYVPGNRSHIVEARRVNGAPHLVADILSSSSVQADRQLKMGAYSRGGVPHLWLVYPHKLILEAYCLSGDKYSLIVMGRGDTEVAHPRLPGLTVCLSELWPKTTGDGNEDQ